MTDESYLDVDIPEGWALETVKPLTPQKVRLKLRRRPENENLKVKVMGEDR